MDVVPGHYNTMWFRPTKPGRYHFFCSQYCGTNHAVMGGWVTVMEPSDYEAWLSGSSAPMRIPSSPGKSSLRRRPAARAICRRQRPRAIAERRLSRRKFCWRTAPPSPRTMLIIRESILAPNAKIVAGFQPLMPTFQGQLTEEQILALTAYIKSLQSQPVPATGAGIAPAGKK